MVLCVNSFEEFVIVLTGWAHGTLSLKMRIVADLRRPRRPRATNSPLTMRLQSRLSISIGVARGFLNSSSHESKLSSGSWDAILFPPYVNWAATCIRVTRFLEKTRQLWCKNNKFSLRLNWDYVQTMLRFCLNYAENMLILCWEYADIPLRLCWD